MQAIKKIGYFSMIALLSFAFNVFGQNAHSYIGAKKCGMCHRSKRAGEQFKIWKNSLHSHAYETLKTKKADEISMKQDGKKAVDNEKCLVCHATGYNVDKKLLGRHFKIEDGVQCETCHGPGSDYKSMRVMKNRQKAVAAGLKLYKNPKKLCVTCHNKKSPTFKSFNFKKMWAKIKHYKPTKK